MISIVIITSTSLRHKFFVNSLAKEFNVVGIVTEEKKPIASSEQKEENDIIINHFESMKQAENKYFGENNDFSIASDLILKVENGRSNDENVFTWVKNKNPDLIILYGSSIIKDPILSYFDGRIINIHLGLSPYYKGSGTNFWPLCNNEPECIGATIHLAILKVDAGAILAQVRPEGLTVTDTCYDIGCKAIISGTKKMIECIRLYRENKIIPAKQQAGGLLFRRADFNAGAVVKMQDNFKHGMMADYLNNKKIRDSKYPIIEI